ncbi:MAG: hypothetical protein EP329_10230 [Deltaproteobacteria bacterium]|nr:MAG: hypothetical protein EP329_10230 [Deltaproteobacteria bacterium]
MKPFARLSLALLVAAGAPAAAAAETPTVHVKQSDVKDCNTDGGRVQCSVGVKTIAKGLFYGLEEQPIACPDVKPGVYTLALLYEYNDGTVLFYSHELASIGDKQAVKTTPLVDEEALRDAYGKRLKRLPNLPACIREQAMPRLAGLLLKHLDVIRPIDPDADVRATYTLKLEVR